LRNEKEVSSEQAGTNLRQYSLYGRPRYIPMRSTSRTRIN
jgi:hypothetical protein